MQLIKIQILNMELNHSSTFKIMCFKMHPYLQFQIVGFFFFFHILKLQFFKNALSN
jgi:hypothetical protein